MMITNKNCQQGTNKVSKRKLFSICIHVNVQCSRSNTVGKTQTVCIRISKHNEAYRKTYKRTTKKPTTKAKTTTLERRRKKRENLFTLFGVFSHY